VRALFYVLREESKPDYWRVRYAANRLAGTLDRIPREASSAYRARPLTYCRTSVQLGAYFSVVGSVSSTILQSVGPPIVKLTRRDISWNVTALVRCVPRRRVGHYGPAGDWQEFKRARVARFADIQSGDQRGDSLAGAGL
jgi:hypothetical protein